MKTKPKKKPTKPVSVSLSLSAYKRMGKIAKAAKVPLSTLFTIAVIAGLESLEEMLRDTDIGGTK